MFRLTFHGEQEPKSPAWNVRLGLAPTEPREQSPKHRVDVASPLLILPESPSGESAGVRADRRSVTAAAAADVSTAGCANTIFQAGVGVRGNIAVHHPAAVDLSRGRRRKACLRCAGGRRRN